MESLDATFPPAWMGYGNAILDRVDGRAYITVHYAFSSSKFNRLARSDKGLDAAEAAQKQSPFRHFSAAVRMVSNSLQRLESIGLILLNWVLNIFVYKFGPAIGIMEYSFFSNPSVPTEVKRSWLDVKLCQDGSPSCHAPNSTNIQGELKFPKHSNEETLKTVFYPFKDIKVIQFSSMQDAFSGFTDKGREAKFKKRMKRYTGIWCCVENHIPGHIYYDMYWDEKPDWKPIPPQNPEDDHPPW